jgi:integrase
MAGKRGVRTVPRQDGTMGYEVRYREGERHRSKTFDRLVDAERFYLETRRRAQLGELFDHGRAATTLTEFVTGRWLEDYALHNLRASTVQDYVELLDRHVLPHLGHSPMRQLTPLTIDEYKSKLVKAGVGAPTVRRALYILQGIARQAVIWEYMTSNPVQVIRKPRQKRVSDITVHPPARIEALRRYLLDNGRPRDALLVCCMAYAGLRPGEALALRWRHIRRTTILVDGAASQGIDEDTKTHGSRTVDLLAPLAEDLEAWRDLCSPGYDDLLFPDSKGRIWPDHTYRNWRSRVFVRAARAVEMPGRPYDCRHSFVTLLIYSGVALPEVARQAGHGPDVCASTYVHVLADYDPARPIDPDTEIRAAREVATR